MTKIEDDNKKKRKRKVEKVKLLNRFESRRGVRVFLDKANKKLQIENTFEIVKPLYHLVSVD